MKTIFLFVVTSFLIISCEKNDEHIIDKPANPFIGVWDWTSSDYTDTYTFEDSTFVYYMGGQQARFTGSYTYTDKILTLVFDNQNMPDYVFEYVITDNGLILDNEATFIKRN